MTRLEQMDARLNRIEARLTDAQSMAENVGIFMQ